jgi:hypothetical protein
MFDPGSTTTVEGAIPGVEPPIDVALDAVSALGTRAEIEAELDRMVSEVKEFYGYEPDQVMRICSAFSARLTELSMHLHRVEGRFREYKQVRTMQVQPLLAELDRQFRLASRSVEMRRQDLELMRG